MGPRRSRPKKKIRLSFNRAQLQKIHRTFYWIGISICVILTVGSLILGDFALVVLNGTAGLEAEYVSGALLPAFVFGYFPFVAFLRRLRPGMKSFWKKAAVYLGSVTACVLLALGLGMLLDPQDQLSHYRSPVGNCSKLFGFALKSRPAAAVIRAVASQFDPLQQYIYYSAEEACRVTNLNAAIFETPSNLCHTLKSEEGNRSDCFRKAATALHAESPFFSVGSTLIAAIAVKAATVGRDLAQSKTDPEKAEATLEMMDSVLTSLELATRRRKPKELIVGLREDALTPKTISIIQRMMKEIEESDEKIATWQPLATLYESRNEVEELTSAIVLAFDHHVLIASHDVILPRLETASRQVRKKLPRRAPAFESRLQSIDRRLAQIQRQSRTLRKSLPLFLPPLDR